MNRYGIGILGSTIVAVCCLQARAAPPSDRPGAAPMREGVPVPACVKDPDTVPDGSPQGPTTGREIEMNGPALNGTRIASGGTSRTAATRAAEGGTALRVITLKSGVSLADGSIACDVKVEGSELRSAQKPASRFVGALLLGKTTEGEPVRLRIDELTPAADPRPETAANENADVLLYRVSWQSGTFRGESPKTWVATSDWQPLCAESERAVAMPGRWSYASGKSGNGGRMSSDPTLLTFACQSSAIAKCIERMGYKPWERRSGVALTPHHEACVRAVRADYCGDGIALTRAGQSINIYDQIGIQKDAADWRFEAQWTPQGARCLNATRLVRVPGAAGSPEPIEVRRYVEDRCRSTLLHNGQPCLAPQAGAGALIFTEFNPDGQAQ